MAGPQAQEYIRSLPFSPGVPLSQLYPKANPLALDLLSKLLAFDPAKRITCTEALRHPYLAIWHDPQDEILCPERFDFAFENEDTSEGMRQMIVDEVRAFRRMVRTPPAARQNSGPKRQETCVHSNSACWPDLKADEGSFTLADFLYPRETTS